MIPTSIETKLSVKILLAASQVKRFVTFWNLPVADLRMRRSIPSRYTLGDRRMHDKEIDL